MYVEAYVEVFVVRNCPKCEYQPICYEGERKPRFVFTLCTLCVHFVSIFQYLCALTLQKGFSPCNEVSKFPKFLIFFGERSELFAKGEGILARHREALPSEAGRGLGAQPPVWSRGSAPGGG